MKRFKPGDAVLIIPKFVHLYTAPRAVIIDVKENRFRPMFNEYTVEFADHSTAKLLEFQIIEDVPGCETLIADLAFDSGPEAGIIQSSGEPSSRRIILQTRAFQIDMRISTIKSRGTVTGQIQERSTKNSIEDVEVTLLRDAVFISSVTSPRLGVFEFIDLPFGSLNILATLPQHFYRIWGSFSV